MSGGEELIEEINVTEQQCQFSSSFPHILYISGVFLSGVFLFVSGEGLDMHEHTISMNRFWKPRLSLGGGGSG